MCWSLFLTHVSLSLCNNSHKRLLLLHFLTKHKILEKWKIWIPTTIYLRQWLWCDAATRWHDVLMEFMWKLKNFILSFHECLYSISQDIITFAVLCHNLKKVKFVENLRALDGEDSFHAIEWKINVFKVSLKFLTLACNGTPVYAKELLVRPCVIFFTALYKFFLIFFVCTQNTHIFVV